MKFSDDMLHTQIIAGLRDSRLRRRLMADDSKTLNQVIADVKAAELTKQQDEIMQKSSESASVEAINAKARGKRPKPKPISTKPFQARDDRNTKPASQNKKACHRCGSKQSHPLQECRAIETQFATFVPYADIFRASAAENE